MGLRTGLAFGQDPYGQCGAGRARQDKSHCQTASSPADVKHKLRNIVVSKRGNVKFVNHCKRAYEFYNKSALRS